MLNVYVTPNIDTHTWDYNVTIRFASDDSFTYSKVIVGRGYKSRKLFEKYNLPDYSNNDIYFGESRNEESFDLNLFNFRLAEDRDFIYLLIIQVNNTGIFDDVDQYWYYHSELGLFKTTWDQALAIILGDNYVSKFDPELIEAILTQKWDYEDDTYNVLLTSERDVIYTSNGLKVKVLKESLLEEGE